MRHQQEFLKALLDKAVSTGTVTNLGTFKDFVTSVASALTVDKDFSLIDLGWQFHSLRSDNLTFLTSPNLGSDDDRRRRAWWCSDKQKAPALLRRDGQGHTGGLAGPASYRDRGRLIDPGRPARPRRPSRARSGGKLTAVRAIPCAGGPPPVPVPVAPGRGRPRDAAPPRGAA